MVVVLVALAITVAERDLRAQGRPYAPTPVIPDTPTNDPLLQMEIASVRAADVPTRGEVDIPPYPNAVLIRSSPVQRRPDSGRTRIVRLPVLVLVTADSIQAVLAFYRERLPDWQYRQVLGGHFFWRGEEEFDPFGEAALTTKSLQVRESRRVKLVPDARTEIHVRYRPRRVHVQYQPGASAPPR